MRASRKILLPLKWERSIRTALNALKGGERMRREVDSKLPKLKEMGGYIPSADHIVHVEFTLGKPKEYADYIKANLSTKTELC